MNERIKLLAEQATTKISFRLDPNTYKHIDDPEGDLERFEFDKQKFAQLIVQDCMNQVREQYLPVLEDEVMMKDTHWDGYVQCGVDSYVAIREHFGVEE